jgi:hypothetical protein
MEPTQQLSQRSTIGDLPSQIRSPVPEASIEDLDAPAYTRALTPLPEFERRQVIRASEQGDDINRAFNQQYCI